MLLAQLSQFAEAGERYNKASHLLLIELDRHLIGSGGLLLEVSPHICSPGFSFMGGVGKKVNN
jgi:hypothetical protein